MMLRGSDWTPRWRDGAMGRRWAGEGDVISCRMSQWPSLSVAKALSMFRQETIWLSLAWPAIGCVPLGPHSLHELTF